MSFPFYKQKSLKSQCKNLNEAAVHCSIEIFVCLFCMFICQEGLSDVFGAQRGSWQQDALGKFSSFSGNMWCTHGVRCYLKYRQIGLYQDVLPQPHGLWFLLHRTLFGSEQAQQLLEGFCTPKALAIILLA
jgi:hypothetical protein